MAPEVLHGQMYNHKADVWSLGCIAYELLFGFTTFTGRDQRNLIENIAKGTYKIPKITKSLKLIISKIINNRAVKTPYLKN